MPILSFDLRKLVFPALLCATTVSGTVYAQETISDSDSEYSVSDSNSLSDTTLDQEERVYFTQEPAPEDPAVLPPTIVEGIQPAFDPVIGGGVIFGDLGTVLNGSGSGAYLDLSEINNQSYDNIDRVLNRVPGVYMRGEDGFGNFPNISLRGVDTTRSSKVTIMEDGVLTAPAAYAAPAAYYFPTVGRMSAVEVIKGNSQIMFGPHTTGGAINFLSTPIPEEPTIFLRSLYGTNGEYRMHSWIGSTAELETGRFGILLEGYLRETDGFKHFTQPAGMSGGPATSSLSNTQHTGFTQGDAMLKMFWEPNSFDVYRRWEAKAGYSNFVANETYLGLTQDDFAADPYQRYAASQFDNMDSEHSRTYLRYTLGSVEEDGFSLTSTAYYNRFHRNWYKFGSGVDANGASFKAPAALAGASPTGLATLRGTAAGQWKYRANNRDYSSFGYDTVASTQIETDRAVHDIKAGVRYHSDEINPYQHNDTYDVNANGMVTGVTFGAPGSHRNREQEVHSLAMYVKDDINFGRLTVSPGMRYEKLHLSTIDFKGDNVLKSADMSLTAGGVGVTYDVSDQVKFLGGFHRGFSPPSPRAHINDGLNEEESLASEYGFRYVNEERALAGQLIAFYTHFNDLIVIDNIGGTGTGESENAGQVYSGGLEFSLQYDRGIDQNLGFSNPWFLTGTYTDARQLNDSNSDDAESLFAGGLAGNRLPYIPEWAMTFGSGWHFDSMGFEIRGIWVDDQFTTASNVLSSDTDARFGQIPESLIWDFSSYVWLADNVKLFGGMQNMFDAEYLTSLHPYGARPGMPFFGYLGIEATY